MNKKPKVHREQYKLNKGKALTVCIAAIADNGMIVGASDTMLTAGDVEFEPAYQESPRLGKITNLTGSVVAMTAGNAAVQAEIIFHYLFPAISAWLKANPNRFIPVEEIVQLYADSYNQLRHKKAEFAILRRIGLTYDTFHANQKSYSPEFVDRITRALSGYELEPVETIIAGIEPALNPMETFTRLYVLNGEDWSCFDTIRYASIGIGSRHASSHFMQSRHGASSPMADTLLSVYVAKKKSEVAPGVGNDTNMFVLGPALGSFTWVRTEIQAELDATYQELKRKQACATSEANDRTKKYLDEIIAKSAVDNNQAAGQSPNVASSAPPASASPDIPYAAP